MHSGKRAAQGGFVYIALLTGLTILGIGLGATSEVWTQTRQREKEQELLFVGNQFRQAITRFYLQSPPTARRFPVTLEELLEDLRTPDKPQRYLRQLYSDPMNRGAQWGELRLPSGQLVGVYSQSSETPLKVAGFALRDKDFADKDRYSDWVFRSPLPAANPLLGAGQGYTAPGASGAPGTPGYTPPTRQPRPSAPTPPGYIQPVPRAR
jgi:type II secretory pathway pseudopilin PulG